MFAFGIVGLPSGKSLGCKPWIFVNPLVFSQYVNLGGYSMVFYQPCVQFQWNKFNS